MFCCREKIIVPFAFLFIFVACGGDSGSNASNDEPKSSTSATFTYKTYEGLVAERPCVQTLNGVVAHVSSTNEDYICRDDASIGDWSWQPYQDGNGSIIGENGQTYETFVDLRDGHVYKMVTIGSQTWMAENLDFVTEKNYCFKDYSTGLEDCKKGRYYTWSDVIDSVGRFSNDGLGWGYSGNKLVEKLVLDYPVRGICPQGWHLPDTSEWNTLVLFVGNPPYGLVDANASYFKGLGATNSSGFSAKGVGSWNGSGCYQCYSTENSSSIYYWSSTPDIYDQRCKNAYIFSLAYGMNGSFPKAEITNGEIIHDKYALPVRCIKNSDESKTTIASSSSGKVQSSSSARIPLDGDYFIDNRDDQAYRIVTIGSQTWMAQNLNYDDENGYCYGNKDENCSQYGRLYYGTNHCPAGWHLPTIDEWNVLIDFVGGASVAGKMLKSATGWNEFGNGVDAYEFSALPAGSYYARQSFNAIGDGTVFMADTVKNDSMSVHYVSINGEKDGVSFGGMNKKYMDLPTGTSIRCLKGSSAVDVEKNTSSSSSVAPRSSSSSYSSTLIDSRDGQSYKVVKIGKQIWMAQNLNFETDDSYCYDDQEENCAKYGRLYTWTAAMDGEGWFSGDAVGCGDGKKCSPTYPVHGICPTGWHLPSSDECEALLTTVGKDNASTVLFSKTGWDGGRNGTDKYGFSALPAGGKVDFGVYLGVGTETWFWTSTEKYASSADVMRLEYSIAMLDDDGKFAGYSVRCVMD